MINPTPSPACLASGGSLTEPSKCKFPFVHEGIAYDTCITSNHTAYWCYTDHTSGHWGECAIGCPTDGCCSYLEIKEERGEENGIYQRRLESSPWVYQQIGISGDAKCIFFLGVWSVDWCAWMEVGGLLACPEDGVIKVFDEGEEIVDLELLDLELDIRVTCKAGLVQRKVPEKTTAIPYNIVKQSSDVDKENNLEVNLRNKEETTPRNFFTKDNYENSLILGLAALVILAVTVVVVVKTTGRKVEIGHVERNQIYGVYYYPDGSRRQNVQEVVDENDEYNMNTRQATLTDRNSQYSQGEDNISEADGDYARL